MFREVLGHIRRAKWVRLVALFVAGVFALVPVVQAFCDIEMPAAGAADAYSRHAPDDPSGDNHSPDPCCEEFPVAVASAPEKSDEPIAVAASILDHPLLALPTVLHSPPSLRVAQNRLRLATPPPEPPFRRFMRLLL
jgi:hypothetical protein